MNEYKEEFLKKLLNIKSFQLKEFDVPVESQPDFGNTFSSPSSLYNVKSLRLKIIDGLFENKLPHDSLLFSSNNFIPYKFLIDYFEKIDIYYFNCFTETSFSCFFKIKSKNKQFEEMMFEIFVDDGLPSSTCPDLFLSDKKNNTKKSFNQIVDTKFLCYSKNFIYTYKNIKNLETFFDLNNKIYNEIITKPKKNNISIISSSMGGIKKTKYEIEQIDKSCLDYYDSEIKDKSNEIINLINKRKKGLFLFHGEKGCGKTTFIKYIINNCEKDFYYINGESLTAFSTGSFLEFMTYKSKNSVFIFEDNEHLLASREQKTNNIISDILNASDGILSDIISPIFIFTFNTKIENIDQAFLRPGRLILEQEFKKLPFNHAKKIAKKLNTKITEDKEYSLAEIFEKQNSISNLQVRSKKFASEKSNAMGFARIES